MYLLPGTVGDMEALTLPVARSVKLRKLDAVAKPVHMTEGDTLEETAIPCEGGVAATFVGEPAVRDMTDSRMDRSPAL